MSKLKAGDPAPDFNAQTDQGQPISLKDYRGKQVVLYFYPKDNTSGCTAQACGFRDAYPKIEAGNAVVLGVSPDSAASHLRFKDKYELPFTLLVDSDHSIAVAYGAWGEKSMYGRKYMGIIRSHFIIDEQGRVADAQYKVSPKASVEKALRSLQG